MRGVDTDMNRAVMTHFAYYRLCYQVNLKGPGSLNCKKTDFKVYGQKRNVYFEGAHATKISTVPIRALPRGTVQVPINSLPHPHVHTQGIKIKILHNNFPLRTLPVNTAAGANTL